ncbi:trithorax group protein osa-like [Folsomia candida]|uniref:trithorax group protein osa-like n=1 Tax=Folsomia candida TaxID=158441 RepID=UPI001604AE21|nr:trithorax group protein osa-like [Folsomia candida]
MEVTCNLCGRTLKALKVYTYILHFRKVHRYFEIDNITIGDIDRAFLVDLENRRLHRKKPGPSSCKTVYGDDKTSDQNGPHGGPGSVDNSAPHHQQQQVQSQQQHHYDSSCKYVPPHSPMTPGSVGMNPPTPPQQQQGHPPLLEICSTHARSSTTPFAPNPTTSSPVSTNTATSSSVPPPASHSAVVTSKPIATSGPSQLRRSAANVSRNAAAHVTRDAPTNDGVPAAAAAARNGHGGRMRKGDNGRCATSTLVPPPPLQGHGMPPQQPVIQRRVGETPNPAAMFPIRPPPQQQQQMQNNHGQGMASSGSHSHQSHQGLDPRNMYTNFGPADAYAAMYQQQQHPAIRHQYHPSRMPPRMSSSSWHHSSRPQFPPPQLPQQHHGREASSNRHIQNLPAPSRSLAKLQQLAHGMGGGAMSSSTAMTATPTAPPVAPPAPHNLRYQQYQQQMQQQAQVAAYYHRYPGAQQPPTTSGGGQRPHAYAQRPPSMTNGGRQHGQDPRQTGPYSGLMPQLNPNMRR